MKKREYYLDLARCIAILLVIGLHVIAPHIVTPAYYGSRMWLIWVASNELFRAGVPLFFMISGYLMLSGPAAGDAVSFYRKRLPRLLLPLLCWNVIYYLCYALLDGRTPSLKELADQLLSSGSAYHMWFVYTMLGIYLVTPFLQKIVQGCRRRELLLLLAVILFPGTIRTAINTFLPVTLFVFDPLMEGYLGYFLLGYLLGSARLSPGQRAAAYLLGILGAAVGAGVNLSASSPEAIVMPFNQGYSINHYLCAAAIFIACMQLCRGLPQGAGRLLARASDLVFGVYWVHVLILEVLSRRLAPFALSMAAYMLVLMLLTALLSFAFAFLAGRVRPLRRLLM